MDAHMSKPLRIEQALGTLNRLIAEGSKNTKRTASTLTLAQQQAKA